jgi:hypothetical protein
MNITITTKKLMLPNERRLAKRKYFISRNSYTGLSASRNARAISKPVEAVNQKSICSRSLVAWFTKGKSPLRKNL